MSGYGVETAKRGLRGARLFQIFLFFFAPMASAPLHASNEVIDGFMLTTCLTRTCIRVRAPEARRSLLSTNFVFLYPKVEMVTDGKVDVWNGDSGYYDIESGYIVLRGKPNLLVNLDESRITKIK